MKRKTDRSFLEKAQKGMKEWWELMEKRGTRPDKPMKPQVVAWELGKRLAVRRDRQLRQRHHHHLVGAADSGEAGPDAHPVRQPGEHGVRACLTPLAAQIAYPERQCVAFVGDGGFSMLMADFVTAVKYKLPIKVVIIKNNTLGQIKWEQMVFLGNPEYGVDLHPIDFCRVRPRVRRSGLHGGRSGAVRDGDRGISGRAGTSHLKAEIDPFEPPMPAKITADQALKFAESLAARRTQSRKDSGDRAGDRVRELI